MENELQIAFQRIRMKLEDCYREVAMVEQAILPNAEPVIEPPVRAESPRDNYEEKLRRIEEKLDNKQKQIELLEMDFNAKLRDSEKKRIKAEEDLILAKNLLRIDRAEEGEPVSVTNAPIAPPVEGVEKQPIPTVKKIKSKFGW